MSTNLSKKDKKILFLAAFAILLAWLLPLFISNGMTWYENYSQRGEEKVKEVETANKPKSPLTKAVEQHLEGLQQLSMGEQAEILGIPNPVISKYEIVNSTGNAEKSQVVVRIFIVNSYLEKTVFLTRNNDLWEVEKIEGPADLNYAKNGLLIKHNSDWEAYTSQNNAESIAEWTLKNTTNGTKAVFFIEEKGGNYSNAFINCSLEQVSNCGEKVLGDKKFKTAIFQGVIRTYVLEGVTSNLVVLDVSEGDGMELEGILGGIEEI